MKIGMACDHAGIELKEEIKIYLSLIDYTNQLHKNTKTISY